MYSVEYICTNAEILVTTTNMMAVKPSKENPQSRDKDAVENQEKKWI
jgi:hypothetical protein